jgi:hypothetical protein
MAKGSTTRKIGTGIARLIVKAKCCVMARCYGQDVGIVEVHGITAVLDSGIRVGLDKLRIHCDTVLQIRGIINTQKGNSMFNPTDERQSEDSRECEQYEAGDWSSESVLPITVQTVLGPITYTPHIDDVLEFTLPQERWFKDRPLLRAR